MPEEDLAAAEGQLGMRHDPAAIGEAKPFLETERAAEPVDRRRDVLVEQVGGDGLHGPRLPFGRPDGMRIMALTTERGWSDFDFRQYGQWR